MPTLSIVRTDFGKVLKWGGIIIGAIIILFLIFRVLLFIKDLILPSAPPPPTVTFGELPRQYFPESIKKNFTYEIDTLTGELPAFNTSERVYKMEQRGPDILAVERASEKMSALDFNSRPQQISDFEYRWTNPDPPQQNILLNIKLSEFILTSSLQNYEQEMGGEKFIENSEPVDAAKRFLNILGFYPEDIEEDKTKTEFGILSGGSITPTTRIINSNVATVYFFQKNKDELPIVYPQGKNSSMKLVVGAYKSGVVLDGKFSYQKILDETATYPIKTAEEAFDELKSGKAYVATYDGVGENIKIKDVYPALYSEGRLQEFLSPVIVFEGNDNFTAYVPAVKDEWINN